jgi:hypothetical protein
VDLVVDPRDWRCVVRNLAGNPECDLWIAEELRRAMIPAEACEPDRCEVPSLLIGRLGAITFRRAWTYWVATGPVPIDIAHRLYEDPIGRTDIRVDGHCGCPAPVHPWTEIVDGQECVTSYHIDSEAGLRIFADAVRPLARKS